MNGTRRFSPSVLGGVVAICVSAVVVTLLRGSFGGADEVRALPGPTLLTTTYSGVEAQAVAPDGSRLYLTTGYGVTVVDPVTRAEVGTIDFSDLSQPPYHVTPSPDGKRIYVSTSRGIVPVDLADNVKQSLIEAPDRNGCTSSAVTPDGQRLVCWLGGSDAVSVVDLANRTMSPPTALPGIDHLDIAITPDGTRAYLAGSSAKSTSDPSAGRSFPLVMLDVHTQAVTRIDIDDPELALPNHAHVEMSPDGRSLYVIVKNHVAVLDTATNQMIRKITVEPLDEYLTGHVEIAPYYNDAVVLSPNGRYLLSVSIAGLTLGTEVESIPDITPDITVIDLSTGEIVATGRFRSDLDTRLTGAQFAPDGRHLYVSDESHAAILDTADLAA